MEERDLGVWVPCQSEKRKWLEVEWKGFKVNFKGCSRNVGGGRK